MDERHQEKILSEGITTDKSKRGPLFKVESIEAPKKEQLENSVQKFFGVMNINAKPFGVPS